jgi:hypothetical protein
LVTSPSTAPNTVGRSHPPDTSRRRCDQPATSAAAPVSADGSRMLLCHLPDYPSPAWSAVPHLAG